MRQQFLALALLASACQDTSEPPVLLACEGAGSIVSITSDRVTMGREIYDVVEKTDVAIKGREPAKPEESAGTILINRVTQQVRVTSRISAPATDVLDDYCDSKISQQDCIDRMKKVDGGNSLACLRQENPVATRRCSVRARGDRVISSLGYDCKRTERTL